MRRSFIVAVIALAAQVAVWAGQTAKSAAPAEQQLIQLDKDFTTAVLKGDASALAKLLASDFKQTDQNGRTADRSEFLNLAKDSAGKMPQMTAEEYDVRVSGTTAIVTHRSTDSSSRQQFKNTHVWTKQGSAWKVVASSATPIREPSSAPVLACSTSSFEAETFQFYGDAPTIIQKLTGGHVDVGSRRVYLLLLETDDAAELALFERNPANHEQMMVAQWRGNTAGDLREELTRALLANHGIACTGEQTKHLIKVRYDIRNTTTIAAPMSARAAFSHLVKKYGASYMRATVFLFC